LGQAQAAAEFQLGFVEVGLQPVEGRLIQFATAQGVGQRAGDGGAGLQDGLVVGQHNRVGDLRVGHGHAGTEVSEDLHDGLGAGAFLGELGAQGVSEPVGVDGGLAVVGEDAQLVADAAQRDGEQVVDVGEPAVVEEEVADHLADVGVVHAAVVLSGAQVNDPADRLGGLGVDGHGAFLERLAGGQPGCVPGSGVGADQH
jgi:hypothetical protein